MDITLGVKWGLDFAAQLELLVPAWNHAFSVEVNRRAWKQGGFSADGITMRPLWRQKHKQLGKNVDKRALSKAERRQNMINGHNIIGPMKPAVDFIESLRPPWDLGLAATGDASKAQCSTRSNVNEIQALPCPANSEPGLKIKRFHADIVALSKCM
tara:strand:- start:277 stop:744 length:468 start_codon:yes stop_codon:yes gene_type:complete